MAVSILDAPSNADALFEASLTLSYSVSAGSDRLLVVSAFHEHPTDALFTDVDYGGQSLVLAVEQESNTASSYINSASIYYLLDSGITAASNTTITPNASGSDDVLAVIAASYAGVDQTGGATTLIDTDSAGAATPNPLALAVTEADEGLVVGAVTSQPGGSTISWDADLTERIDAETSDSGGYQYGYADRLSSTDASVTVEATLSGTPLRMAAVAAAFAPAVATTVTQEGFRFRNDDGSETTATWIEAQDTNAEVQAGELFRIRFVIDATGDPDSTQYTLEEKLSTESTYKKVELE